MNENKKENYEFSYSHKYQSVYYFDRIHKKKRKLETNVEIL